MQAHLQFAQTDPQSKNCKRACKANTNREREIIKMPHARLTKMTDDF